MLRIVTVILSMIVLPGAQARADYRQTVPILRIGMLETHPAMGDPLRIKTIEQAYSTALEIPVEIIRFPDLPALVDAQASARVKYAVHTAMSFAATQAVCDCLRPLMRPVDSDGTSGFRAVLVMRAEPGHEPPVIAYSHRQSLSGWIMPREAMLSGSLPPATEEMAGTVADAIAMFIDGRADGLYGWMPEGGDNARRSLPEQLFNGAYAEALGEIEGMTVSWLSEPVYNGPHAVNSSLPEDLAQILITFLEEMPQKAPGLLDILEPLNSGGFQKATEDDYGNLINLVSGMRDEPAALTGATPSLQ